jgi:hypothetical protein
LQLPGRTPPTSWDRRDIVARGTWLMTVMMDLAIRGSGFKESMHVIFDGEMQKVAIATAGIGLESINLRFSGAWTGTGIARLAGGNVESLKCRAYYTPRNSGQSLGLVIRCASPSTPLELRAALSTAQQKISGSSSRIRRQIRIERHACETPAKAPRSLASWDRPCSTGKRRPSLR